MADIETKPVTKPEEKPEERAAPSAAWRSMEGLRREIDRLFEDFDPWSWRFPTRGLLEIEPFRKRTTPPAVDIVEREKDFQVTAELPGMSESDFELKVANDMLSIKGEKKEEDEESRKDYRLSERRYGAFERSFRLPEGVDTGRIEASFKKGVLTVTLPRKPETLQAERKIAVTAG